MSIRDQKLIYHLTAISNLEGIFTLGLLPRSSSPATVLDVADPEILEGREVGELEEYVPFHFFAGTPFAGAVQKKHANDEFVFICIRRTVAESNGFMVVPSHPLNNKTPLEVLPYHKGLARIDWPAMERREYNDPQSKQACMAECLASGKVDQSRFCNLYVRTEEAKSLVEEMANRPSVYVNVNQRMFVPRSS